MQYRILGPLAVRSADGAEIATGGPRPRTLLALLLLDAGHVVPVERLIDGLYGEDPPSDAPNALQAQVSRLRRRIGPVIEHSPAGYRLTVDPDEIDAHRFRRLAREGREALNRGDNVRAVALLREGLQLWRGPALADVPLDPTRLEELRITAIEDRAEAGLALGDYDVATLQEAVAAYPLRERLRGQLMRALYGSGRQAEALAAYEDARRTLADELGADPSPELADVHLALLRAEPAARRASVPAQFTSFVGRADELTRLQAMLATARLVTLTGPGGVGKTRLAIEAATGESCFVDLSDVADGARIPQVIMSALGLRETGLLPAPGPADATGRLVDALADAKLLLILDNCEHVVADAARLIHRLLGACPDLRALVTSREALGITGETLYPLAPLDLDPAVRLFTERAAAVRPGFQPNEDVIRRICEALDGLPLAIELAAARLRSMPLDEVAARLDDRFQLLSRGDRTAAPRHQTLRAVVEWSWDLLSEEEQTLARRLTVFADGATMDAAERVCGLPGLADLVDKSLVEVVGGRYRMLETVRTFCAERLAEAGEEDAVRQAHVAYFLDLAQTAEPYLRRAEQVDWLARLSSENGNLLAALRYADPASALRLVAAVASYWWLRGMRGEVADLLDALGSGPPEGLEDEYVLCVLHAPPGGPHWERAKAIMKTLDRPPRQPFTVFLWSVAVGPSAGIPIRFSSDPWSRALDLLGQGMLRQFQGDPREDEFADALDGFREIGDRWGITNSLDQLARLADWRGDHARALALTDEAIELIGPLGALEELADLYCQRADRLIHAGDRTGAHASYGRAAELARGWPDTTARVYCGLGELARFAGDLTEARRLQELALADTTPDSFGGSEVRSRVLIALARIAEAEGDAAEASARLEEALTPHNRPLEAEVAEGMAGVALLEGDAGRAAFLLGRAAGLRGLLVAGDPDVARIAGRAVELLGPEPYDAAFARGSATGR